MNPKILFFSLLAVLLSIGATSTLAQSKDKPPAEPAEKASPPEEKPAPEKPANKSSVLEYTGKILSLPGEDNVYGIESDTGDKYVPVNLPELLKEEGLWVHLKAEKVKEKQDKPGWGEYIRILSIAVDPCLTADVQVE
jgi:hypothetical protein